MIRGPAVRVRTVLALAGLLAPLAFVAVVTAPSAAAEDPAATPGALVSIEPTRLLDTRSGIGAPIAPVAARGSVTVPIAGRGAVPAATDVAAVCLTLTVTQPRASGYLSARPTGGGVTGTSTLNFSTGQTLANSALVALGAGGQLTVDNIAGGSSQVIVDVTGYTLSGTATEPGSVVGLRPARLIDTRSGIGTPKAPVAPGASIVVGTLGRAGLPLAGVAAVVLNLTATATTNSGYLAAGPADSPPGQVSNLNWVRTGQTVANQAQVRVDPDGRIVVVNRGSRPVAVVADVQGYVVAGRPSVGGTLATFAAQRAADTRGCCGGPVDATPRRFGLGAVTALPTFTSPNGYSVSAVVATVTVTRTTGSGYLTVWSGQGPKPTASNANWAGAGQTVASQVVIPVVDDLHQFVGVAVTGGRADVVVDVSAYVLLDPSAAPPAVDVAATGFQQNAAHDGHAAGSIPSTATQKWDVDFGADAGTVGYPIIAGGSVYVVTHQVGGEPPSAASLWRYDLAGNPLAGPITLPGEYHDNRLAWDSGRLYVVDDAGGISAYAADLTLIWSRVGTESSLQPTVAAAGGRVYATTNGAATAYDGGTGNILWAASAPDLSEGAGVVVDATGVYLSGGSQDVTYKFDLTGRQLWEYRPGTTGAGSGTPVVHHGRLWARVDNGLQGTVLDATRGTAIGPYVAERPVVFAGQLAVLAANGAITAVDEADGRQVWQQGAGVNDLRGALSTTDDAVYVGATDSTVRGYALATGQLMWSAPTPVEPNGSLGWDSGMAIGGGLLVVPNGSHLTAFG